MWAYAVPEPGAQLRRLELPVPEVGARDVLVRVAATSINPIDVLVATGRYPWGRFVYPCVPGWDFSGVVAAVGRDVTRFVAGDPVFGHWAKRVFGDGSFAEYIAVEEDSPVAPLPGSLAHDQAAALPLAAVTAVLAVEGVAPDAGDDVLVVGASGAVGAYVVQLAARAGARVLATGKQSDEGRLRKWGADVVIDYRRHSVEEALAELGIDRVPILVDIVNDADDVTRLAALVKDGGRVVSARFAADADALGRRGITAVNVDAQRCGGRPMMTLADTASSLDVLCDRVCGFDDLPDEIVRHAAGGAGKSVFVASGG